METITENPSSLQRTLNLAVSFANMEAEVGNRLKRLARTVKMDGFRPGKVPMKIVEQQYGGQVRQEVLGEMVQKNFAEAVRAQNLKVAGYPRIEPMPVDGESEHLQFTASFEVYPDVVVGDISGVAIDRPQVAVGDAEVDKTIEILRKQRVTYAPVERQAATGDQVEIDYRGTLNGEEFQGGQAQGYKLVLGEGQTLKDFEGAILGMTAGESKSFELTFPEDYHAKELAGKTVIFAVTLNRVAEPKLPEVDADFAKSLGVSDGSMETMRSEIKANLEREVKKRIDGRVKERVMQALLDATPFEQPRSLIEMEIDNLRQQAGEDLRARGLSASGDISLPAHLFEDQARRRVSLGLIMSELVNAHQLLAKPEQVRELVNDLAQSYEQPEHVLAWYYAEPNRLASVESLVIEDNVVQWVLERAEVVEVTSAFDELMGNNQ
ncbi:MAG: trigger factor [Betaproteobacteria bacterium CG2_30_59_46]|nr:MAG: trigger factor [Betaproteobacteria bacterium CG2_30_59_46]PIQ14264.1 MAG: trigger factor [Hydrogenophilales bacterium CG18_big_fil_WC_8_21_14_2_50_58_12]PIX98849.1 MAG: trigger factor [Hydrogenophilales bacterium CG_4_10_14_3_um_filter_58_23]PJB08176.1 MAG: trigger factor [Hydrogenophilales bacterium CG_4_9_14_3_um_filter_59_35]